MNRSSSHILEPLFNNSSKILILGSFPSVKSMEKGFYYLHPQNRFYKVLDAILSENMYFESIEYKKRTLLNNRIALYDSIEKCDIISSDDSSIKNIIPSDINYFINNSSIEKIFLNGKKAYEVFLKYNPELVNMAICLPSTSPANARYKLDDLIKEWSVIKEYL